MEPTAIPTDDRIADAAAARIVPSQALRTVVRGALAMSGELDQRTLLTTALESSRNTFDADGASFWGPSGDQAACQLAVGRDADTLRGTSVPAASLDGGDSTPTVMAVPIISGSRPVGYLRVSRDAEPFSETDRELLELLAESTASSLKLASRIKAADRSSDLTLIQELSREIGSSLDLDRVLQTVVNIAARAVQFDLGALALYENGKCDVRALAGAAAVDPKSDEMQDLAFRAAWAAGTGEMFYLSDREAPGSDTERIFLQFFDAELAKVEMNSGLYLPLRDEEGVVGILLLEAKRAEFASAREREVATILANQATVAIRNAKLYSQVPLAEALGAISAKRAAFFSIPRRRRTTAAVATIVVVALMTLIRWPLRVAAEHPTFRPTSFAIARPLVGGTVDRVLVAEGATVAAGAPLMQLRDAEARAERSRADADVRIARREAQLALSAGDGAALRIGDLRESAARAELSVRDQALQSLTVRAPVAGVVLTPRPELLLDTKLQPGDGALTIGRTDTLELEFSVEQREIDRVRLDDIVRIRLDALPQQTFEGRVTWISVMPEGGSSRDSASVVRFPMRAVVPNATGALKPGMAAHARVLTAPASLAQRLLRTPWRNIRLFWWRMWSWL